VKRAALGSSLVLLLLLVLAQAPSASAHTGLVTSDPAAGAVLASVPTQIRLSFDEELLAETVKISVVDAAGTAVLILDPVVDGANVTTTWPPGLVGPDYTVNYRVVSSDGHPVSGSISFTAGTAPASTPATSAASASPTTPAPTAPAPTSPAATTTSASGADTSSTRSVIPLIAISAGLALGVAVGLLLILRRRGSASS
jgi:methionine-rich copper-binding protein CopC